MGAAAGKNRRKIGHASALATALAFAHVAQAQDSGSVNDYRLPDPKQTTAPRAQGPVDPENPYSTPSGAPRSQGTPAPAPSAQPSTPPRIVPPATQASEPARERPTPRPSATPTPRASTSAEPTPAASASASAPTPSIAVPVSVPDPAAEPTSTATDEAPSATASPAAETGTETESETNWLLPVAAIVVIGGAAATFLLRRRRKPEEEAIGEEDHAAPPTPELAREPAPAPRPAVVRAPAPPPAVPPVPASAAMAPEPMEITFAPTAIRLSLVYATLQYELTLSNIAQTSTPPLQLRADLSSAHASIPTREQLAPSPALLDLKHEVAPLEPGQTITLKGEVRVPLQQIRPLVKGSASFLVPLARFVVLPADGVGQRRVYTLGPRDPGSGAIASVRLDAGPRNLRELDAREIEAARGFALDPEAVHS